MSFRWFIYGYVAHVYVNELLSYLGKRWAARNDGSD